MILDALTVSCSGEDAEDRSPASWLAGGPSPARGQSCRFVHDLVACYSSCRSARRGNCTRTNMYRLRARTPVQDFRHHGMTHAYDGLCRAFPYVVHEPVELAANRFNNLVHLISCFGWHSHDDAAVAVVGGLHYYLETKPPHSQTRRTSFEILCGTWTQVERRSTVPVDV